MPDRQLVERMRYAWDAQKHPRGQPENKGEFASVQGMSGVGLVSPNEQDAPMAYPEAAQKAHESATANWAHELEDIAQKCGMKAKATISVGDWAPAGETPGAEQSAEVVFSGAKDFDQIKYAMCIMGRQHNQYAVLPFAQDHNGKSTIWEIESKDSPENIRKVLDENDLPFRTLVDMGNGKTKIVIFDENSEKSSNTNRVAKHYGTKRGRRKGTGGFFPPMGTTTSRDESNAEYDKFIAGYEQQHPDRPRYGGSRGNGDSRIDRARRGAGLLHGNAEAENQTSRERYVRILKTRLTLAESDATRERFRRAYRLILARKQTRNSVS